MGKEPPLQQPPQDQPDGMPSLVDALLFGLDHPEVFGDPVYSPATTCLVCGQFPCVCSPLPPVKKVGGSL